MVTANVYHRVYWIRHGSTVGSCFAIDVDDRQYLVTAKHVLTDLRAEDELEIFQQEAWKRLDVKRTGFADVGVDVAVFAARAPLALARLPLPIDSNGVLMAQDVYFLGFPYGSFYTRADHLNRGFPVAFVKRAIISSMPDFKSGAPQVWYLDGINNNGFSGGPAVWTKRGENVYRVLGVVSGFESELHKATVGGVKTELEYSTNTGIIECYDGQYALDIARANPNGAPLAH